MYEQRRPDVAVFIDFENVYVSVRDKLNANPNFEAIMDRCSDLGRVVISRAYADWYRYPRVTSALYANAIEPIYVATYYYDKDMGRTGRAIKNSVDMNLCIDAMKTLFTNPNIGRFVLVTGDRDFIPLVNSIRQQGKEVYIIGIGGAASTHLAQSADEFVFYEQLVGKQHGGSAAASAIANRATELTRNLEVPVPHEPPQREAPEPPTPPVVAPPQPQPAQPTENGIYAILVEAIHLVRKRGYVSTLGSIKLVMKELMGGDFKESRYRDLNGRPFAKFKDFVMDAEKRGKVQIFTNGTVNEVFLPGEDPYKLSQFAAALSEEPPVEPILDTAVLTNGRKEPARTEPAPEATASPTGRRRRRRSRRGHGASQPALDAADQLADEAEFEEPEYTPPVDEPGTPFDDDELRTLDDLEEPAELVALFEEQLPDELAAADLPVELHHDAAFAHLGLVDVAPLTAEELDSGPDKTAWEAAVDAVTAEAAPPPDSAWDEAVAEPAPPPDSAWDEAVNALAAQTVEPTVAPEQAPWQPEPVPHEVAPEPPADEPAAVVDVSTATLSEPTTETEPAVEDDELEDIEAIAFSDQEWTIFTAMMREFSKPASFQQIFDTLRGQRKEHGLTRTNEQLRTMVKQAINNGLLERSGRGKRVYYTLKQAEGAEQG